jgi:dipeptidyl aminopeptidase/acylaminoacyl peptidase
MMKAFKLAIIFLLFAGAAQAAAPASIQSLKKSPLVIDALEYKPEIYEQFPAELQATISKEEYNKHCSEHFMAAAEKMDFFNIFYKSDNFKVKAILGIPKTLAPGKKYPVVIFNHGGDREDSYLTKCDLPHLYGLSALLGESVVVAPQYRGTPGSQGKDEFGGADVHDVTALEKIFGGWDFVDNKNIFMVGTSRGGIMAYRAATQMKLNAIVAESGLSDLFLQEEKRPALKGLYAELMPNYKQDRIRLLTERSAAKWPEKINAPVLILHGSDDSHVDVAHAKIMAAALEKLKKPYKLVIFKKAGHGLPGFYPQMMAEIKNWFLKYRR